MTPTIQEIIDTVKAHYQDWWPEPTGKDLVDESKTFNIRGYEVDVNFAYTASEEYLKNERWLEGSYINELIVVLDGEEVVAEYPFPAELEAFFNDKFHSKYEDK